MEVSLLVVDQFLLWDFVLTDAKSQTVCAREDAEVCCNPVSSYEEISPCQIPQVCLPLSYAAQIPTTPNPDLANVRLSLFNLDHNVGQCSARFFCECMSKELRAREKRLVCDFLCEYVLVHICDLVVLVVCVWSGGWGVITGACTGE